MHILDLTGECLQTIACFLNDSSLKNFRTTCRQIRWATREIFAKREERYNAEVVLNQQLRELGLSGLQYRYAESVTRQGGQSGAADSGDDSQPQKKRQRQLTEEQAIVVSAVADMGGLWTLSCAASAQKLVDGQCQEDVEIEVLAEGRAGDALVSMEVTAAAGVSLPHVWDLFPRPLVDTVGVPPTPLTVLSAAAEEDAVVGDAVSILPAILPNNKKALVALFSSALQRGDVGALRTLLASGKINVNEIISQDLRYKKTALHVLATIPASSAWQLSIGDAKEKMAEMLKLLLEHGADVNLKDWQEYTPIHLAIKYSHSERVRSMFMHAAVVDANVTDRKGDNYICFSLKVPNGSKSDDFTDFLKNQGVRVDDKTKAALQSLKQHKEGIKEQRRSTIPVHSMPLQDVARPQGPVPPAVPAAASAPTQLLVGAWIQEQQARRAAQIQVVNVAPQPISAASQDSQSMAPQPADADGEFEVKRQKKE